MSFANLECNGNEIEMLYERHNKGHSSLMIGKRRNLLMPVQASSNKPTSLDGADAEEDSDQPRSKRTIYFERVAPPSHALSALCGTCGGDGAWAAARGATGSGAPWPCLRA